MALSFASAQAYWEPAGTYLNTASYGLPPATCLGRAPGGLDDWRTGRTSWERWGDSTEQARASFARLISVDPSTVTVGATVSGLVGLVAAAIRTAPVFSPRMWSSRRRSFRFSPRRAAVSRFAWSRRPSWPTRSTTRSTSSPSAPCRWRRGGRRPRSGRGRGGDPWRNDARRCDTGVRLAALDGSRFDIVVAAGYKWLLSPRGTAFMSVSRDRLDDIVPVTASWYGGEDVHASYFGPPLRLAADARRLDTSPAWHSWIGAAAAMAVIEEIGVEAIHAHDLALANSFRAGLGLEAGDSAIVFIDAPGAEERLERAGSGLPCETGGADVVACLQLRRRRRRTLAALRPRPFFWRDYALRAAASSSSQ